MDRLRQQMAEVTNAVLDLATVAVARDAFDSELAIAIAQAFSALQKHFLVSGPRPQVLKLVQIQDRLIGFGNTIAISHLV